MFKRYKKEKREKPKVPKCVIERVPTLDMDEDYDPDFCINSPLNNSEEILKTSKEN